MRPSPPIQIHHCPRIRACCSFLLAALQAGCGAGWHQPSSPAAIADLNPRQQVQLWSYGVGADREWAMLSTATRQPYIEIQGGPIADQSIKLELQPNETRSHTEYWIPTDTRLDIHALAVPRPNLRAVDDVPRFARIVQADGSEAQEKRERGKGPGKPSGGAGPHPTEPSAPSLPCPFGHNTTLQHYLLRSVAPTTTSPKVERTSKNAVWAKFAGRTVYEPR